MKTPPNDEQSLRELDCTKAKIAVQIISKKKGVERNMLLYTYKKLKRLAEPLRRSL